MKKICKKCQKEFQIIKQEKVFLSKMKLPLPQLCPNCRAQRRAATRNENKFYKYPCSKCGKMMITAVDPKKNLNVYCEECYKDFRANIDLTKPAN